MLTNAARLSQRVLKDAYSAFHSMSLARSAFNFPKAQILKDGMVPSRHTVQELPERLELPADLCMHTSLSQEKGRQKYVCMHGGSTHRRGTSSCGLRTQSGGRVAAMDSLPASDGVKTPSAMSSASAVSSVTDPAGAL